MNETTPLLENASSPPPNASPKPSEDESELHKWIRENIPRFVCQKYEAKEDSDGVEDPP